MFIKQGNRKVWRNAKGVSIWLPCDKKTFRIVDDNGVFLSETKFRTFSKAEAFAATI
jgi:hypothetical protein